MKIAAIETIRIAERPNPLRLCVHADGGIAGPGESLFCAAFKIWPLDQTLGAARGQSVSGPDPRNRPWSLERLRGDKGDRIGIMVGFHSKWHVAHDADRKGAGTLSGLLARSPDKDGQSFQPDAPCRAIARAHLGVRDACWPPVFSRPSGSRGGTRGDAWPALVRRTVRGAQDRLEGRGLASAVGPAWLQGAGRAVRRHACIAERPERAAAGKYAPFTAIWSRPCPRLGTG